MAKLKMSLKARSALMSGLKGAAMGGMVKISPKIKQTLKKMLTKRKPPIKMGF